MHEVSLSLQLAAAVRRAAGGRQVRAVYVEIGALRQIVPEALQHAWVFAVRSTPLEAAELELDLLPAVLTCDDCGYDTTLGPELGFRCSACGSASTHVVSGEQFTLTAIDIDIDDRRNPPWDVSTDTTTAPSMPTTTTTPTSTPTPTSTTTAMSTTVPS